MPSTHILNVWNPSYTTNTMDSHLKILLDGARKSKTSKGGVGGSRNTNAAGSHADPHVWWAKLRSPRRRDDNLPHMESILKIQKQIEQGTETHLYLTDFQSLYVGWLDRITSDDLLVDKSEMPFVPGYYRNKNWSVDLWFRLRDIRLVITDDTLGTIDQLKSLKNIAYDNKPVSIYGGIVDPPVLVERETEELWFGSREALIGDRLWRSTTPHCAGRRRESRRN